MKNGQQLLKAELYSLPLKNMFIRFISDMTPSKKEWSNFSFVVSGSSEKGQGVIQFHYTLLVGTDR